MQCDLFFVSNIIVAHSQKLVELHSSHRSIREENMYFLFGAWKR
jgi:hypothetical protein